jgi:hypothetical protein
MRELGTPHPAGEGKDHRALRDGGMGVDRAMDMKMKMKMDMDMDMKTGRPG